MSPPASVATEGGVVFATGSLLTSFSAEGMLLMSAASSSTFRSEKSSSISDVSLRHFFLGTGFALAGSCWIGAGPLRDAVV